MHLRISNHPLCLPFLLVLWFSSNSLFALSSHSLLLSPSAPPNLFLDLTILQILLSYLLSHLLTTRLSPTPTHPLPLSIPTLQLLSTSLTNASYALLGATSTLVVKLLEPLPTFLLSFLLLPTPPPTHKLFSLVPLLCGILLFTLPNHPLPALSPILLSTVLFPLRNILLTLHSRPQPTPTAHSLHALAHQFRSLHAPLVPPLLLAGVLKYLLPPRQVFPILLAPKILLNVMLFATYQLASLAVLTRLQPLSHSLANSLKRFATLFVAAVFTPTVFHSEQTVGLCFTVVGFLGYVFGGRAFGKSKRHTAFAFKLLMGGLGVVSTVLVAGVVMSGTAPSVDRVVESLTMVAESRGEPWIRQQVVIQVMPKYNVDRESIAVMNYSERERIDDQGNIGNFVWQHASYVSLVDLDGRGDGVNEVCWGRRKDCYDSHVKGTTKTMVSYRPGTNYFNLANPNRFADDIDTIKKSLGVPMLAGIGIQAGFAKNKSEVVDLEDGRKIEIGFETFEFAHLAKELLGLMQRNKYEMLVRGEFTLGAIRKEGYGYGVSAGCPTLFLSEEIELGKVLDRGYEKLRGRVGDRSLKVGITLKGGTRFLKFVKDMLAKYPNSIVYAQGMGDFYVLERIGVPFERVKLFTNVLDWQEHMKQMDFCIGSRIHGSMIAVSVGVPVVVVAPDWRVLELVQRMKVPHVSYWEAGRFLNASTDLAGLAGSVTWNAKEFDENRCEMAKRFRRTLGNAGIRVSHHVNDIARIC